MGQVTNISWTQSTASIWWGCEEVGRGCDLCFARVMAKSKGKGDAWEGVRYATKGVWVNLARWQKAAAKAGAVHRVFVGSMMDIFEKPLPASDWNGNPLGITTGDIRDRFFNEVVPACPDLQFQLLTKRPGNILKMVPPSWLRDWPANLITGASVVDQETADTLIPQLLRVPGPRFLSIEPLLGPVDLIGDIDGDRENLGPVWVESPYRTETDYGTEYDVSIECGIDWAIVGGESGPRARPCDLRWVRSLRDQLRSAGVPCWIKQLGRKPRETVTGPEFGFSGVVITEGYEWAMNFRDSHGADESEWPTDLQNCREHYTPAGVQS